MTDTHIMEELSKDYIEAVAHSKGYFNSVSRDYGTDLTIRRVMKTNNRQRYVTSGRVIDFQVKAVTKKYVTIDNDYVKYDFEVKNYQDLIDRFEEKGSYVPLILIVFIMPNDKNERIEVNPSNLVLKECAYWYRLEENFVRTSNKHKIRISIPKKNLIDSDFFPFIFNQTENG